jgi:hypothetical protein
MTHSTAPPRPNSTSLVRDLLVVLLISVGCSTTNPGDGRGFLGGEAGVVPACPMPLIDCPETGPPPTYADDVAPILAAHCTGCHGPGGENQDVLLTSYAALAKKNGTSSIAQTAIADVLGCKMPPSPLLRVPEQEQKTLVCWLKAKTPK